MRVELCDTVLIRGVNLYLLNPVLLPPVACCLWDFQISRNLLVNPHKAHGPKADSKRANRWQVRFGECRQTDQKSNQVSHQIAECLGSRNVLRHDISLRTCASDSGPLQPRRTAGVKATNYVINRRSARWFITRRPESGRLAPGPSICYPGLQGDGQGSLKDKNGPSASINRMHRARVHGRF